MDPGHDLLKTEDTYHIGWQCKVSVTFWQPRGSNFGWTPRVNSWQSKQAPVWPSWLEQSREGHSQLPFSCRLNMGHVGQAVLGAFVPSMSSTSNQHLMLKMSARFRLVPVPTWPFSLKIIGIGLPHPPLQGAVSCTHRPQGCSPFLIGYVETCSHQTLSSHTLRLIRLSCWSTGH